MSLHQRLRRAREIRTMGLALAILCRPQRPPRAHGGWYAVLTASPPQSRARTLLPHRRRKKRRLRLRRAATRTARLSDEDMWRSSWRVARPAGGAAHASPSSAVQSASDLRAVESRPPPNNADKRHGWDDHNRSRRPNWSPRGHDGPSGAPCSVCEIR